MSPKKKVTSQKGKHGKRGETPARESNEGGNFIRLPFTRSKEKKLEEAATLCERISSDLERVMGAGHWWVLDSQSYLPDILEEQGKLEEAEALLRKLANGYESAFGAEHPYTLTSMHNLAWMLYNQNKLSEAESLIRRAVEVSFGC